MTNREKQERLVMADYIDSSGKIRAILEELYKYPEKDWGKPETQEAVQARVVDENIK